MNIDAVNKAYRTEWDRIDFYINNRGIPEADAFVLRVYPVYRKMLFDNRSRASVKEARPGYIGSCIAFREYMKRMKINE